MWRIDDGGKSGNHDDGGRRPGADAGAFGADGAGGAGSRRGGAGADRGYPDAGGAENGGGFRRHHRCVQ